jgi:hypothetical protein
VFHVKLCLWCVETVSDYLRIIDSTGSAVNERMRGAKLTLRIKTHIHSTSRAPTGLLRKMYDEKWLKQQEIDCPFYIEDELIQRGF